MLYTHVIVQNQKENTKYSVVDDIKNSKTKHRYLVLENCRTNIQTKIQIGYYSGRTRLLISENVLSGANGFSPRYLIAKVFDSVIEISNDF